MSFAFAFRKQRESEEIRVYAVDLYVRLQNIWGKEHFHGMCEWGSRSVCDYVFPCDIFFLVWPHDVSPLVRTYFPSVLLYLHVKRVRVLHEAFEVTEWDCRRLLWRTKTAKESGIKGKIRQWILLYPLGTPRGMRRGGSGSWSRYIGPGCHCNQQRAFGKIIKGTMS